MTKQDRRTFMRTISAGSLGTLAIGATGTAAAATTITIKGGGADIWNDYDEFHYYYEEVTGDFDVTVKVDSLENTNEYAKAGLMIRQSLADDEEHAMIRKMPGHDTSFQWRSDNGDQAVSTTSDGGADQSEVSGGTIAADWQRLVRDGDTIRAYGSNDGSNWTLISEISPSSGPIDFAESADVGLAVTSHNTGTLCTAEFSSLSGLSPSSNTDVGDVDVTGSVSTSDGDNGGGGDTNPIVSTGSASDVTDSSATLNGAIDDLGDATSATVSFEYRTSDASTWTATPSQTLSSTGTFSDDVSGLSNNTEYEFRAVLEASDGDTDTGTTVSFTTGTDNGGGSGSGSNLHYEDGFADASWFGDDVEVIKVGANFDEIEAAFTKDSKRLIVFEESGVVDLQGADLSITYGDCWVAGQTAPSPGITFINGMVQVEQNNTIVQHIRVFRGDESGGEGTDPINNRDGSENVIFDHCTSYWGRDENLSVGYDSDRTTISNCLVAEGLEDPEENSNGTLVGDGATNVAILGTIYAKNNDRNPRLKSDTDTVVVNGLNYYFDKAIWIDGGAQASAVGNAYIGRFDWSDAVIKGDGDVYIDDNVVSDPGLNGRDFFSANGLSSAPNWPSGLNAMPSSDVESHNLANAGARPADRISHEERVITDIRNRRLDTNVSDPADSDIPDSHTAVGGFPDHGGTSHSLSVPSSGLRDWIDQWALAVEDPNASPP